MSARSEGVRTIVFTDLDDTLFRTARKIPEPELARSVKVAHAGNGRHSFMTPRQRALLDWFDPARTVPVTARGSEAFSRVQLPFAGAAVVANGAVILDADGVPDEAWREETRRALAPHRASLDALPERILAEAARHGVEVRTWLVEEPGCGGIYAVAKSDDDPSGAALDGLAPALGAGLGGWTVHLNGNNLALIPPGISKGRAVARLLERSRAAGEVLAIGVGDSASDLGFMRLCDLWMTPARSQIDALLPYSNAAEAPSADSARTYGSSA